MESKVLHQDTITASTTQTLAGARAVATGADTGSELGSYLSAKASVHIVTTVATAGDAVALPAKDPKLAGMKKTIINRGANYLQIFPDSGGAIGQQTANSAFLLAPGDRVELMCTDGRDWAVTVDRTKMVSVTKAYSTTTDDMTADDDMKAITFTSAGGNSAFKLPAPDKFRKIMFVKADAKSATDAVAISSSSANLIQGAVTINVTPTHVINATTVTFTANIGGVGQWLLFESDGEYVNVSGQSTADAGAFTVA